MNVPLRKYRQLPSSSDSSTTAQASEACASPSFGDYELIVDTFLAGDAALKRRIAMADADHRGGLAVLKNALRNRSVAVTGRFSDILRSCELDQLYHDQRRSDLNHIEARGQSYRVTITVELNVFRRSFSSLSEAQNYRDRMLLLALRLKAED
jgi:hypothetical protein